MERETESRSSRRRLILASYSSRTGWLRFEESRIFCICCSSPVFCSVSSRILLGASRANSLLDLRSSWALERSISLSSRALSRTFSRFAFSLERTRLASDILLLSESISDDSDCLVASSSAIMDSSPSACMSARARRSAAAPVARESLCSVLAVTRAWSLSTTFSWRWYSAFRFLKTALYLLDMRAMVAASALRLVVETIFRTLSLVSDFDSVSRESSWDLRLSMAFFRAPTASSISSVPSRFSSPSMRFISASWYPKVNALLPGSKVSPLTVTALTPSEERMYPIASVSTRTVSPARKLTAPWNSPSHFITLERVPITPADLSTSTSLVLLTSLSGITEKDFAFSDFAALMSRVMAVRSWTTKAPVHLPMMALTAFA